MLGARIAALRRQAGFSQAELAQRLKISASAVGMYEQGRREPAADLLVALADIFGVSVDYLLTGHPGTEQEIQTADRTVLSSMAELERKLNRRRTTPFSRQELTVLFAALLMES
jgi:transcriptional regulator with XRE-family HTH domain